MSSLIAQLSSGEVGIGSQIPAASDLLPSVGVVLSIVGGIIAAVSIVVLGRWWLGKRGEQERAAGRVVLKLTVPREIPESGGTPRTVTEYGASAEAFAGALWSALRRRQPFSVGRLLSSASGIGSEPVTLEIVAHGGSVQFYAVVPKELTEAVTLAARSAYPLVSVETVPDYNLFLPSGAVAARAFTLRQRSIFPLRTTTTLGQDFLPTLITALARAKDHGGALLQLTLLPAGTGWQQQARRVARTLVLGPSNKTPSALNPLSQFRSAPLTPPAPHELTQADQALAAAIEGKASKVGFRVNLRIVAAAPTAAEADERLRGIAATFTALAAQESQQQIVPQLALPGGTTVSDSIYRHFRQRGAFTLNTEELTTVFHLPFPGSNPPSVAWLSARQLPAPPQLPAEGILLGVNRAGGAERPVRLALDDRRRHLYTIGATGVGKSVLMANLILQDIAAGHGVGVIDPHGSLIEAVLAAYPENRRDDLILFEPASTERPVGLNLLEADTPAERDRAAAEMIAIFLKLFPPEVVGPMFEHTMRNALLTLMADPEHPNTLVEIPRLLTDRSFRDALVARVTDPLVRAYWEGEQAKTSAFHQSEMLGYVISKVGRFVENTTIRNIIGQARSTLSFPEVLAGRKVLLVNLSRGSLGELNADLLGLILVAKLQLAAFARADEPGVEHPDFFLYLDEFQHFVTDSVATVLSEARKYRLNLTLAHQYLGQLVRGADTLVRDAVLGNAGSVVAFRVGVEDAPVLAQHLAPDVSAYDLTNLDRFTAYAKLLVANVATPAFTLSTLPPAPGNPIAAGELRSAARGRSGRPRPEVEAEILERSRLGSTAPLPAPPLASEVTPRA
jgi:hypothetical protein